MRTKNLGLVLAVATVAALSGCTAPASSQAPEPARTSSTASGTDSHPGGADEDHGVPAVTWGPAMDAEVKALASDLMGKFARADVTERAWFNALQLHMSPDYQESAQYIDPGRIPVRTILSDPVLVREKGNPMSVMAEFATNDGPWVLSLHRTGQDEPWLITRIAPKDS
ncbi:MAG: putative Lipoprotein [Pseudarthrobacter sp.]|nr:putative Lipoprotein [Pseudarthrobacter sp.]